MKQICFVQSFIESNVFSLQQIESSNYGWDLFFLFLLYASSIMDYRAPSVHIFPWVWPCVCDYHITEMMMIIQKLWAEQLDSRTAAAPWLERVITKALLSDHMAFCLSHYFIFCEMLKWLFDVVDSTKHECSKPWNRDYITH